MSHLVACCRIRILCIIYVRHCPCDILLEVSFSWLGVREIEMLYAFVVHLCVPVAGVYASEVCQISLPAPALSRVLVFDFMWVFNERVCSIPSPQTQPPWGHLTDPHSSGNRGVTSSKERDLIRFVCLVSFVRTRLLKSRCCSVGVEYRCCTNASCMLCS